MKQIFIAYAHYDDASFNAAIKKTFIETAKEKGHEVDCVDLYKEKFNPVYSGEKPEAIVIDHQKRIEPIISFLSNSLFVGIEKFDENTGLFFFLNK